MNVQNNENDIFMYRLTNSLTNSLKTVVLTASGFFGGVPLGFHGLGGRGFGTVEGICRGAHVAQSALLAVG